MNHERIAFVTLTLPTLAGLGLLAYILWNQAAPDWVYACIGSFLDFI